MAEAHGAANLLGPFPDVAGYDKARELDATDPLASYRSEFVVTDPELIYLDGNSLGRLPKTAPSLVADVVERQWGERLVRAWGDGWWDLQLEIGELLAPLLGAKAGEVVISDSTSVNLFKLAIAAVAARPGRTKIVTDDMNFPTDLYVLEGAARLADGDHQVEVVASDGVDGPVAELAAAIDQNTALVTLSHTVFKSGYTYDLDEITRVAHEAGAMMLWDCSHSVGSVPIDFAAADVDLAVGCTYKYLNGGPGSPAFLYVRTDLQDQLDNPIPAWWAHSEPFAFDLDFNPTGGIRRFHTGTMPVLSLAASRAGIEMVAAAGMPAIRAKSVALTDFLVDQWRTYLRPLGFALASPGNADRRGSHISLAHPDAWRITRAMVEQAKVIPDFREPDNLRLGLSPLTLTFEQVHTAVQRIRRTLESGAHQKYSPDRGAVT